MRTIVCQTTQIKGRSGDAGMALRRRGVSRRWGEKKIGRDAPGIRFLLINWFISWFKWKY